LPQEDYFLLVTNKSSAKSTIIHEKKPTTAAKQELTDRPTREVLISKYTFAMVFKIKKGYAKLKHVLLGVP
jgi:hypothetical protein